MLVNNIDTSTKKNKSEFNYINLEKLVNKYNDDLEAVASAEGFDITPNVDLEMSDIIGKKIMELVNLLEKRNKLPKDVVLTEKNIKTFKKQLAELKATRSP
jgi:leucyl-tRNA synthetase